MSGNNWYLGWVELHCEATGADDATARVLLALEPVAREVWQATAAELGECTRRLVASLKVPKFANEHTDAIGLALIALRDERKRAEVGPAPSESSGCPKCGGCGWASVPHPKCLSHGRLVAYPGQRGIATVAVTCDCPRGEHEARVEEKRAGSAKPGSRLANRRPTLRDYLLRVPADDPVGLLREYEREQAAASRRQAGANDPLHQTLGALAAKYGLKRGD